MDTYFYSLGMILNSAIHRVADINTLADLMTLADAIAKENNQ